MKHLGTHHHDTLARSYSIVKDQDSGYVRTSETPLAAHRRRNLIISDVPIMSNPPTFGTHSNGDTMAGVIGGHDPFPRAGCHSHIIFQFLCVSPSVTIASLSSFGAESSAAMQSACYH